MLAVKQVVNSLSVKTFILFLIGVIFLASCSAQDKSDTAGSNSPTPFSTTTGSPNNASLLDSMDRPYIYRDSPQIFEHLTVADGLSQSDVRTGLQDQFGFMWFGTNDGLNRYDGYMFTIFRNDPDNPSSLKSSIIHAAFEDRASKAIWLGTQQGLTRFDMIHETAEAFTHQENNPLSLSNDIVNVIYRDLSGKLWVGTEAGLNLFDEAGKDFTVYEPPPSPSGVDESLIVNAIKEDEEGNLWLGTNQGLLKFDPVSKQFGTIPEAISRLFISEKLTVLSLAFDHHSNLWIATIGGLFRLSADGLTVNQYQHHENQPGSLGSNWVNVVFEDRLGMIWVGTEVGVSLYDPSVDGFLQVIPDPERSGNISEANIYSILQDQSGLLWFLTDNGVVKLDVSSKRFDQIRYRSAEGSVTDINMISDIQQDSAGDLWYGSAEGLIRYRPDRDEFVRYTNIPSDDTSLSYNRVTALLLDHNGRLWVGTSEGGVNIYFPQQDNFIRYSNDPVEESSLSSRMVSVMYEDRAGNIWVGYDAGRVDMLNVDRSRVTHYVLSISGADRQRRNRVRAIVEDRRGLIWAGTAYGLFTLDPASGTVTRIASEPTLNSELSDDFVTALHESRNGILWIGTYGGGLNKYDPQTGVYKSYRVKDGMPNDSILGILEDKQGRLWLSTNLGIACFDPVTGIFQNFDDTDGLQSNDFNEYSFYQNETGEMFFGGVNGITAFYPEDIQSNPFIPQVMLTSFNHGEEEAAALQTFDSGQEIVIRWPDNDFEFEFAVLNFRQPSKNLYAYRLEGFESDWNRIGNRRYGRYTNLPGGSYQLHLIGSNDDYVWNTTGTMVSIKVVPPVWQRKWFQFTGIVLAILGVGVGYLLQVKNVRERNRLLAAQVEERTREIEQRRQVAEGLRSVFILLNSSRSLEESLSFIQQQILRLAGARFAWIFQLGSNLECKGTLLAPQGESLPKYLTDELVNWFSVYVHDHRKRLVSDWPTLSGSQPQLNKPELRWIRTVVCIPIIPEKDIFGGLVAFFDEVKRFSEEEVNLLNSFAEQASLAVGNQMLREKAEEVAVISERTRLARDLHDAVTQTLFSASLIAEALPHIWENNPGEGRKLLGELRQLNKGALADMRSLLMELRPATLVEARLSDLIRQLIESLSGRTSAKINITCLDDAALPEEIHLGFYRIAQEALTNVIKHARARKVQISLCVAPGVDKNGGGGSRLSAILEIEDDGCGFDLEKVPPVHFGLKNIRDRARAIGADISLSSQPGQGTRIRLSWEGEGRSDG